MSPRNPTTNVTNIETQFCVDSIGPPATRARRSANPHTYPPGKVGTHVNRRACQVHAYDSKIGNFRDSSRNINSAPSPPPGDLPFGPDSSSKIGSEFDYALSLNSVQNPANTTTISATTPFSTLLSVPIPASRIQHHIPHPPTYIGPLGHVFGVGRGQDSISPSAPTASPCLHSSSPPTGIPNLIHEGINSENAETGKRRSNQPSVQVNKSSKNSQTTHPANCDQSLTHVDAPT
jgi:hypothetical protein